ncbi:MAG: hypothetical protein AAFX06_06425 [Planctomycetota bacterium]
MKDIHFTTRRMIGASITLLAIAVCWVIAQWESARLGRPAIATGVTALIGLFGLVLLGVRRRIPFWPLGNASIWTQVHIYVGFFTTAIYFIHVPRIIGDGIFECFLSLLFLSVSVSGFYGLFISRTLPKKLAAIEGQHRFDRMVWHRDEIAKTASGVVEKLTDSATSRVLGTFYGKVLQPFFSSRPSLAYVIAPNGNRRRQLLGDLKELDRYLESDGRTAAGKFAALVRRRDDLDYQFALQLRLRTWLVFHGLLSIVLIIVAVVHAVLAFRFTG